MRNFKESVVYQIYIKSFKDTDGNGTGDLRGIEEKLPYLKELGIDYIWITPFYVSPMVDNGYDVADYRNIDKVFGNMDDFDSLMKKANELEIGIMLDMVFNHSSTEHEWFKKAMNGEKKYRDFYIFKESKDEYPPTNWQSKFGGSAWEKIEAKEYYLHLFDRTQADLNWDNPELRREIYDIVNFWMKKGVSGFRFDVVNLISKPEKFEDSLIDDGRHFYTDGPNIHKYLKELNRETFGKDKSLVTVGEMSSTSIENSVKYSNPDENELSMVFSFHHLKVDYEKGNKWSDIPFDFLELKRIISSWQEKMQEGNGWNAVFLNNHDQPRAVSRFGNDEKYHTESAKMLATFIHLLRGTPYIYQGEELGITNSYFKSIDEFKDVESKNYYKILKEEGKSEDEIIRILQMKSRDNGRTPMLWNNEKNFGFTDGTPWIDFGYGKKVTAEEAIKDSHSIFSYYKKLIDLRHSVNIVVNGKFREILKGRNDIYVYERYIENDVITVILNFYDKEVELTSELDLIKEKLKGKMIISAYGDMPKDRLRAYEAVVVRNDE